MKQNQAWALAIMVAGSFGLWVLGFGGPGGCGGGGSGGSGGSGGGVAGQFSGVDVASTDTSGALSVGGNVSINSDGNIVMLLNAIPNPDNPSTPYASSDLKFTESFTPDSSTLIVNDSKETGVDFTCTTDKSTGATSPADIVFVLDTTGSMESAIDGVRNSIETFATAISDSNDVRFALVTYGNEVNTDDDLGCLRRFLDFSGTDSAGSAAALKNFIEDGSNGVAACGGNDIPENSLGALDEARFGGALHLSFRTGAKRIFILITDAVSHGKEGTATQCGTIDTNVIPAPPSVKDLTANMGGDAVFTVTSNMTANTDPNDGCVDPNVMAINGGIHIDLSDNLNLVSGIPLTSFLNGGYVMTCIPPFICPNNHGIPTVGGFLECTATDSKGRSGTVRWGVNMHCLD